jgi:GDP-4-dehydro-6-deoxy-D-mannose reductase
MKISKNVLITGCSGFLASHLIDALKEGNGTNLVLSGITEETAFHSSRINVFHVDITDRQKVFDAVKTINPVLTFHLAAIANVGYSWAHPQTTYQVNFVGTSNILEAVAEYSPGSRVLLMSSGELYGGNNGEPCKETTPILPPTNPYALSKVAMEMLGDLFYLYCKKKQLEIIKLRAFNFTGPGQSRQFMASDFSYQISQIEKGKQEPSIHVGNLSAQRDFSDVRDIARYLNIAAEKGKPGGVYNLCSGLVFSIEQILDMLLSFSNKKIEKIVDEERFRPVDIPRSVGDSTLIREEFNLYPQYQMKQTLQDILDYWRKK